MKVLATFLHVYNYSVSLYHSYVIQKLMLLTTFSLSLFLLSRLFYNVLSCG